MKARLLTLLVCLCAAVAAFAQPANDHFANAQELVGASIVVAGQNFDAGFEAMEPEHDFGGAMASVWYKWSVSAAGVATVHTRGSTFDTVLGVFRGSSFFDLTEVTS